MLFDVVNSFEYPELLDVLWLSDNQGLSEPLGYAYPFYSPRFHFIYMNLKINRNGQVSQNKIFGFKINFKKYYTMGYKVCNVILYNIIIVIKKPFSYEKG